MMSLGTWTARSTKYQRFLNLSNVFLMITSIILLFLSAVLIMFYHLMKMDFWSWHFYACPLTMMTLGIYTFLVSVYGFLISNNESRGLVSMIAIFLSIAFLGQMFSVFSAMMLRTEIDLKVVPYSELYTNMGQYGIDETITANWDSLQREMRCCGGDSYEGGYLEWRGKTDELTRNAAVPDSCCHEEKPNCGHKKLELYQHNVGTNLGVWKDGCIKILSKKLKDEVVPLMFVYCGVGVLLALVELITVVLACAYVAQIGRRKRRNEMFTRAATADDQEFLPSLTSKETNF